MTREEFLKDINNWSNYKYLLWPAIQAVKGSKLPLLELGAGHGSTPLLRQFCEENGMEFRSYDNNKEWAEIMGVGYVKDWDAHRLWNEDYCLCFIDMAPGEYRKRALMKVNAEIIVIHDSEPKGWTKSDYQVRGKFKQFRYVRDYKTKGAWTTALSHTIDVRKWDV